jgi:hypothetical protein
MTPPNRAQSASYYYADGKRVALEPDPDHVAIDLRLAASRPLHLSVEKLKPRMSVLPGGGVAVVPRALVPKQILAELESIGALQPVYRASGARIVTYPEVRVEVESGRREAVVSAIQESGIPTEVGSEEHGKMVLRPKSGRGVDALSLANFIYERAHPPMAQARFMRIVPRPDAQRRSS